MEFESCTLKIMESGWDCIKRVMSQPAEVPNERVSKTCMKYENRLLIDLVDGTLTITQADRVV